jgi:hypothetical protein
MASDVPTWGLLWRRLRALFRTPRLCQQCDEPQVKEFLLSPGGGHRVWVCPGAHHPLARLRRDTGASHE